jgi:hypothetical protein
MMGFGRVDESDRNRVSKKSQTEDLTVFLLEKEQKDGVFYRLLR